MRVNYAIVFVSDMAQSVLFYRDVLGLPIKFESPEWTEFATEGATFALHKSDGINSVNDIRQSKAAGQCRPGLQVPNLEEFHKRMIEQNIACAQPPTDVYGTMIAQYIDPDGLQISISEETQTD